MALFFSVPGGGVSFESEDVAQTVADRSRAQREGPELPSFFPALQGFDALVPAPRQLLTAKEAF